MSELFRNVLTASFHGSVVIVAVILLRLVLKKTPKKFLCFLWLLAGVRLLMPFEIQSSLSLQPNRELLTQTVREEIREDLPVANLPEVMPAVPEDAAAPEDVQADYGDAFTPPKQENLTEGEQALYDASYPEQPEKTAVMDWTVVAAWLWLGVASCFAIYSVYSYIHLRLQVREAIKIPGGWESDRIDTAFILGFIKPKIYIPMGMTKTVRKHILAHERTHLEKGDHWFKMIGFLALAIHWFNPLVWAAYILLCKDIEMACDERVVQFMDLSERKSYSAALLSCSTNRAHFAACPVAFGEVSVKYRIKSVLQYRKPSFWISLLGVIAIAFVAVCLVTSPAGGGEAGTPVPEETSPAETAQMEPLSLEEQVRSRVEEGITSAIAQENYHLEFYVSMDQGSVGWQVYYYKQGDNTLWRSSNHAASKGGMHLDGKDYVLVEEQWMEGEPEESQLEHYLSFFHLEGKDIFSASFETKTGEYSGEIYEKATFTAQWPQEDGILNTQPMEARFRADGSLSRVEVSNIRYQDWDNFSVAIYDDSEESLRKVFVEQANRMAPEDFEEIRNARPSNYTEYDTNFALGAGQMGWQFLDGEWFFKFGAEDVTRTSAKIVVEYSGQYGSNSVSSAAVTSASEYYIEQLVDGRWVDVPRITDSFHTIEPKALGAGGTLSIDWTENYGALPGGFYRIGMYYDCAASAGQTDRQLCYAKFRLYNENADVLIKQCREGLQQLRKQTHFLLHNHQNFSTAPDGVDPKFVVSEVWRNGSNWLEASRAYFKSTEELSHGTGVMVRDGAAYTLNWVDSDPTKAVTEWESNTYIDEINFNVILNGLEWYDSQLVDISGDAKKVTILLETSWDYYGVEKDELQFAFDDEGNLAGIIRTFLTEDGSRLVEDELTVLDTTAQEIDAFLDAQDVTSPPYFSWEEDKNSVGEKDTAKIGGFKNTQQRSSVDVKSVQTLAHAEAPLYEDGYGTIMESNMKTVYYDDSAQMWKVSCKFSFDHTIWHDVYIDQNGVTQLVITREIDPEW